MQQDPELKVNLDYNERLAIDNNIYFNLIILRSKVFELSKSLGVDEVEYTIVRIFNFAKDVTFFLIASFSNYHKCFSMRETKN